MKIVRVQLDFPEDRVEEINKLMNEAKIATRKDFINNALTLLEWAIEERRVGKLIGSLDKEAETFERIILPCIEEFKPKT